MTIHLNLRMLATTSLLALAVVASPVLGGDALAAGKKDTRAPAVVAPAGAGHAALTTNTRLPAGSDAPVRTMYLDVFPDEGGPATEAVCDAWEDKINEALQDLSDAVDSGNQVAIQWAQDLIDARVSVALDKGCIVLW